MKNKITSALAITVCFWAMNGCKDENDVSNGLSIVPVSPYADTVYVSEQQNPRNTKDTMYVRYFLVQDSVQLKDSVVLKKGLLSYMDKQKADIGNKHFDVYFYKSSTRLNKNYKETGDDLIGQYDEERLAYLTYFQGKLVTFWLFNNGRPIATRPTAE